MKTVFPTLIALVAAIVLSSAAQADTWKCDAVHSNVTFNVNHLVISEVQGSFKVFDGTMTTSKSDMSDAVISFSVNTASINTDNEMRDGHLRSDDFFNAEKYPAMTFKSTGMTKTGANTYKLMGNLTIRDVTKPVTFDVRFGGEAKNGMGKQARGFVAETTIDRMDYNLKWNKLTEAGGAMVGKDVRIRCNMEMMKN
ncbi:MAG: YceI family protein [Candidatus Kapaibacterium sp.]